MMLYRFDKKIRLLLFNEIEKIEVAVRCAIVNFGTEMTGNPFGMTDANNFSNPSKFNRSIRFIEDSPWLSFWLGKRTIVAIKGI